MIQNGKELVSPIEEFSELFTFIDVITIEKTGEFFRLLYDVKGRFVCHRISSEESAVSSHYYNLILEN